MELILMSFFPPLDLRGSLVHPIWWLEFCLTFGLHRVLVDAEFRLTNSSNSHEASFIKFLNKSIKIDGCHSRWKGVNLRTNNLGVAHEPQHLFASVHLSLMQICKSMEIFSQLVPWSDLKFAVSGCVLCQTNWKSLWS